MPELLSPSMSKTTGLDRRSFLRAAALGTAAVSLPAPLRGDPYAPFPSTAVPTDAPVRVRGVVRAGGRGLARVPISDGTTVVPTDAEGRFELVAPPWNPFVFLSLPAGMRIPLNAPGTARLYEPIVADARGEMAVTFDLEPLPGGDEEHTFLLWADTQTQNRTEMEWLHAQSVPDAAELVRGLGDRHAFGLACGDIMFDDLSLYPEFERAVSRIGIPFFQVVGNHDLDFDARLSETSTETFSRHFGPGYYSFDRGAVHYVVLNDVFWYAAGYLGYLHRDQLTWLENDLRFVEPGRKVVVVVHIPVMGTRSARAGESTPRISGTVTNREALYRLLEPYDARILSGHTHENEHLIDGGCRHHVSGTVCGAWWSGPICGDGTPNGYAVYEVRGEEITHRYKATGLPLSHQLRAYPHGADPTAPDEIVANVWDWDPDWTVVWYEDGERKGAMARRMGFDPWSRELHTGPNLPPRRTWVEPYPTDHLFYAPASRGARAIVVEATDPRGRSYTARVGDPMGLDPAIWIDAP